MRHWRAGFMLDAWNFHWLYFMDIVSAGELELICLYIMVLSSRPCIFLVGVAWFLWSIGSPYHCLSISMCSFGVVFLILLTFIDPTLASCMFYQGFGLDFVAL